ncbi:type III PLP-dependent enzyme [Altericista sp. CCNU0014]|uniref:type III PLP-dependent enzyme n=1 Tax=Altericista sp. CCNU0014 TaxID=3082949 RepID=UPI003850CE7C
MERVQRLIAEYFNGSDRHLRFGGVAIADLADQYGTPFYAYDRQVLEQTWSRLRCALPPEFTVYYSVKANPNQRILQFFLSKGCGLEIASVGEFDRALRAGCAPARILFAGPGKTEAELERVLEQNIGAVHIESFREMDRISAIARRLGRSARIALRVNPTEEAQGGAMRMGGKPLPFGIDEECLEAALDRAISDPFLSVRGIHLFIGTQILDPAILLAQYRKGIAIAQRAADRLQAPLQTVDFGGGLGIPYFPGEQSLNLEAFRQGLVELMADVRSDPRLTGTQFMVEPGRYLVGEAGIYVVRVNDIKYSRGKKFIIVDGGLHHHLTASGNLGQVIKRNYPVAILNKLNAEARESADIVGPLCTPLDALARNVMLPPAEVGDWVGVFQSGAYARSASPLGFLSHPAPPEIWVEAGKSTLLCPRGQYDTI